MEVAPGVHRFDTGPFNWYVVEEAGRLTVVDAGFPGHYRVLLDGLTSLGRELADVAAVVLTHSHADHTGFAERLRLESGAPVLVHEADAEAVRRSLRLPWYGLLSNAWRGHIRMMLRHAIRNGVFSRPRVTAAHTFKGGDTLDVPGRPEVIHVPGHTPGQVALHLPDRGVLITGDAVVTLNLMTGASGTPQVPHRLLNGNDPRARRSLDALKELGRLTLLTGHGPPWAGTVAEAVEVARG